MFVKEEVFGLKKDELEEEDTDSDTEEEENEEEEIEEEENEEEEEESELGEDEEEGLLNAVMDAIEEDDEEISEDAVVEEDGQDVFEGLCGGICLIHNNRRQNIHKDGHELLFDCNDMVSKISKFQIFIYHFYLFQYGWVSDEEEETAEDMFKDAEEMDEAVFTEIANLMDKYES